jgi:hypothetical protein
VAGYVSEYVFAAWAAPAAAGSLLDDMAARRVHGCGTCHSLVLHFFCALIALPLVCFCSLCACSLGYEHGGGPLTWHASADAAAGATLLHALAQHSSLLRCDAAWIARRVCVCVRVCVRACLV